MNFSVTQQSPSFIILRQGIFSQFQLFHVNDRNDKQINYVACEIFPV